MIRIVIDQEPLKIDSVIISPDEDTCNYGYHASYELNDDEVTATECLSVFCKALEHAGYSKNSIIASLDAIYKYKTEE